VGPAQATVANLTSFKKAYPNVKPVSCKTCHQNPVGRADDLNDYGKELQKLNGPGKAKNLTVKEILSVPFPLPPAPDSPKKSSRRQDAGPIVAVYLDGLLAPSAWAQDERAEYVGAESCAGCHAKQAQEFKHSTHARIAVPEGAHPQGCETCHGPGSLHVAAGGGRGVGGIINPRRDPSTCFACHLDKKAEFRLPFHHPVLEGKMSCADCHSAHGEEIRPWTATSLADINEACFRCHKEQRGPFAWEHEALREGCTTCHKIHGSIHDKMLLARDNTLCLRCHTQVNFPTIGKQGHGGRLPLGTCFSAGCHTAIHGSNFDDHLRY
jgi:predicted CXXCH cytochrome family protein